MNETKRADLDQLRVAALERVKRGERNVQLCIIAAAVIEGCGLLGFLLLMDFGNRLHLLLLVMAFLIYGTLAAGIVALGAYVNLCSRRIVKAILASDGAAGSP